MIKVILVDDHEMVRAGIRRFLEKADEITVVAETDRAESAREIADTTALDVVAIDIKLQFVAHDNYPHSLKSARRQVIGKPSRTAR